MAELWLRVDLETSGRVGPGKIKLLERIGELGSISAAGRALGMSYKRAWQLVDELNRSFHHPVVATRMGGASRGGAELTPCGQEIVLCYRRMEARARAAVAQDLLALELLARPAPAKAGRSEAARQDEARPAVDSPA